MTHAFTDVAQGHAHRKEDDNKLAETQFIYTKPLGVLSLTFPSFHFN